MLRGRSAVGAPRWAQARGSGAGCGAALEAPIPQTEPRWRDNAVLGGWRLESGAGCGLEGREVVGAPWEPRVICLRGPRNAPGLLACRSPCPDFSSRCSPVL